MSEAVAVGNSPTGHKSFIESDKAAAIDPTDCPHGEVEFAHDALRALGTHLRGYVIIEACVDCGRDVTEQAFLYECPLPTTE